MPIAARNSILTLLFYIFHYFSCKLVIGTYRLTGYFVHEIFQPLTEIAMETINPFYCLLMNMKKRSKLEMFLFLIV